MRVQAEDHVIHRASLRPPGAALCRATAASTARGVGADEVDSDAGNTEPVALTVWILYARQVASSSSSLQPRLSRAEAGRPTGGTRSSSAVRSTHYREELGMTALATEAPTTEEIVKLARKQVDAFNSG